MPEFIYVMKDLRKVVPPNREILKGIWLSFFFGAKIGVLGANGAGKSSLLKIMAGLDPQFNGEAFAAKGIKVGMLQQEPQLDPAKSVLDNVKEGAADKLALIDRFNAISDRFAEPLEADEMDKLLAEQAELQDKIDAQGLWDLDQKLEMAMDALRCPPGDAAVATLSGGEKRRVALCRLLLSEPDLLLLDEPTNHLDAESVAWLEHHLAVYPGTVVAVTHDRYFLDNVAGWILELDRGHDPPAHPRARAGVGADVAAGAAGQGEGPAQRLREAGRAIEADHLTKGYGDNLLIEDLSFKLPRGGIVGVIGPNGAGKTTLFRMITGQEKPDGGTLRVGETVKLAYVDQSRDVLKDEMSVYDAISEGQENLEIGGRTINARGFVSSFNFRGADQQKKLGTLSGGERNRVHLARMLKSGSNVLLLDEPTNDLDVDTLRALEDALLEYAGCAVVISHDRWFLNRIATHILAFEGDSQVVWFEGNFDDYEADKKRRLGAGADQPHRIKYRKFTR